MRKTVSFLLAGMAAMVIGGCARKETVSETLPEPENVQEAQEEEEELPVRKRAGERLSEIEESGILMIGVSPDYAPFAFETEEGCAGSDIELGKYIAEALGAEAYFVEMEFEECLEAVKEGTVDVVLLGMLKKPERETFLDFTAVYYKPGKQVLLVKEEQQKAFSSLEKLKGKTVAAQYGTLQAQLVTEQLPESYMELTDTATESIAMLNAGEVDAVALDEAVAEEILKEYTDLSMAEAVFEYTAEAVAGGVVKGETELLKAVDHIIEEVNGEKLYLNWLDAATWQAASLSTPTESPQEHYSASSAAGNEQ